MNMKRLLSLAAATALTLSAAADSAPAFPGGDDALASYISTNMKYPKPAADNGIEGIVNVSFTVNTDGSIGSIKIDNLLDPDLEQEAIRLVKTMPKWTPADKGGTPVAQSVSLPIKFTLPE